MVYKKLNVYIVYIISYTVTFQLYDRRKKCLKSREKEKWSLIDYNYMTEESGDEDSDVIRQHKLVWRSEGTACDCNQVHAWLLFVHGLCVCVLIIKSE